MTNKTIDKARGRVKELAVALTGNRRMKTEGRLDHPKGSAKNAVDEVDDAPGGWYADPYGGGARRWFDEARGWTDRVEGAGLKPEQTGLARVDEAAESSDGSTGHVDADGNPAPLSRPIDYEVLGQV